MWYIFNKNGECVSMCDFEPNVDDLATRGEIAIESEQHHELSQIYFAGNQIQVRPEQPSSFHVWQPEKRKWFLSKGAEKQAFQAAQNAKLAELNRSAQNFINQTAGTDKLPEFEVQSWAFQAAEAKAWAQNPETATPILDQIAAVRGVPADVLKQAALRKTLQYEALTALVAGQRQALQTHIEQAKNLDDLNAIEIAFRLPESE